MPSTKQAAGFDEDLSKFENLADGPRPPQPPASAPPPQTPPAEDDGRLPTIQEETEADLDAYVMEEWYEELNDSTCTFQSLEDVPLEDVFKPPTHFVSDASVPVTVAPDNRCGDAPVLFGNDQLGDEHDLTYQVPM